MSYGVADVAATPEQFHLQYCKAFVQEKTLLYCVLLAFTEFSLNDIPAQSSFRIIIN